ncbi:amine oxidase [Planoprotostelium fungivorum]|uniref:Amine oxidase n=1 Tax=Planoprotostelium fungivorum TaxID=1890364 RepID=A0A2P6NE83_9EUKA|nr:amine oxidase [Planoprotostelium fungivorum]
MSRLSSTVTTTAPLVVPTQSVIVSGVQPVLVQQPIVQRVVQQPIMVQQPVMMQPTVVQQPIMVQQPVVQRVVQQPILQQQPIIHQSVIQPIVQQQPIVQRVVSHQAPVMVQQPVVQRVVQQPIIVQQPVTIKQQPAVVTRTYTNSAILPARLIAVQQPVVWKKLWQRKFGDIEPSVESPKPTRASAVAEGSSVSASDSPEERVLLDFELEESTLAERYHWMHQYLVTTDPFYKRHVEFRDSGEETWVWVGTRDNILRADRTNVLRGQVWVRTTQETALNNLTLRVIMFYGPPDPTKKLEKRMLRRYIPAGKTWRIPFVVQLKAMNAPDTMEDCQFGKYGKCYLRASLDSKIPILAPKVFVFPMKVRRPLSLDPDQLMTPEKKTVGQRKWLWMNQFNITFELHLNHNTFQPGSAIPIKFFVLNEARQQVADMRQWTLGLYLTLTDPTTHTVTNSLVEEHYFESQLSTETFKKYELNGFHIPLVCPNGDFMSHYLRMQLRGHPASMQAVSRNKELNGLHFPSCARHKVTGCPSDFPAAQFSSASRDDRFGSGRMIILMCILSSVAGDGSFVSYGDYFWFDWNTTDGKHLDVTMYGRTNGWISFGLNKYATMMWMDLYTGWVDDTTGQVYLYDRLNSSSWSTGYPIPAMDTYLGGTSDVTILSGSQENGITKISFRRPLITNDDAYDYQIHNDTKLYVLYAFGAEDGNVPENSTSEIIYRQHQGYAKGQSTQAEWIMQPSIRTEVSNATQTTLPSSYPPSSYPPSSQPPSSYPTTDSSTSQSLTATTNSPEQTSIPGRFSTGGFTLEWNMNDTFVNFTMSALTDGWIGVGFNDVNVMSKGDMIVGWVDSHGRGHLHDQYSPNEDMPQNDSEYGGVNDVVLYEATRIDGLLKIRFGRKLVTGDAKDHDIIDKNLYILWAYGGTFSEDSTKRGTPWYGLHSERGGNSINLMTKDDVIIIPTETPRRFDPGQVLVVSFCSILILWFFYRCILFLSPIRIDEGENELICMEDVEKSKEKTLPSKTYKPIPHGSNIYHVINGYRRTRIFRTQVTVEQFFIFFVFLLINFASLWTVPLSQWSGETLGTLIAANLFIVIIPVTRNSLLVLLTGISFERSVNFHRWVGRTIFILVVFHFGLILRSWSNNGIDINYELFNTNDPSNLYGFIAFVTIIFITLTSLPFIRRRLWEAFYISHFSFVLVLIFSCLHNPKVTPYVITASALYLIDRFFRFLWGSFVTETTQFNRRGKGGVVRVSFKKSFFMEKVSSQRVGQYVFVNFPAINPMTWHPFSISSGTHEDEIEINVRELGGFTKRLGEKDGPYGNIDTHLYRYPALVLIVGGIGITPALGILRDIYRKTTKSGEDKVVRHCLESIYLVWTVQTTEQYHWFKEDLDEISEIAIHPNLPQLVRRVHRMTMSRHTSGRPDFGALMEEMMEKHEKVAKGVFACGPDAMTRDVWQEVARRNKRGQSFFVHAETFKFNGELRHLASSAQNLSNCATTWCYSNHRHHGCMRRLPSKVFPLSSALCAICAPKQKIRRQHTQKIEMTQAITMNGPDFPFPYDEFLSHTAGLGQIPSSVHGTEVAIVGGGPAGIVAALELLKMGLRPIVYEADRLGGRMRSERFPGLPEDVVAEMGAMRFPPASTAFWHYANKVQLKTHTFPNPLGEGAPSTVVNVNGRVHHVNTLQDLPPIYQKVAKAWDAALDRVQHQEMQKALAERDVKTIKTIWNKIVAERDNQGFIAFLCEMTGFKSFKTRELFGQVGFGTGGWDTSFPDSILEILRITYTAADCDHRGIIGGSDQLCLKLWEHEPENVTHWEKGTSLASLHENRTPLPAVTAMHRTADGHIAITDVTGTTKTFSTAIFTAHKCLLLHKIDCDPQLFSNDMWTSIERTHYLASAKLFVPVDRAFWRDKDPVTGHDMMSMTLSDRMTRGTYLVESPSNPDGPAAICLSYTWTDDAVKWRSLTPHERLKVALNVLKNIYPNTDIASHIIGEPISISWEDEPNFLGAFKANLPGHYRYQRRLFNHFYQADMEVHHRGLFIAGDDVSWTAGWAEGAVQTGLNAVWGVMNHLGGATHAENPGPGDLFEEMQPVALEEEEPEEADGDDRCNPCGST